MVEDHAPVGGLGDALRRELDGGTRHRLRRRGVACLRDTLGSAPGHLLDGASLAERVASRLAPGELMASLRAYVAQAAAFAETRGGALAAFAAALAVWWIQAIAMPLAGGRDFGTYLGALIELFQSDPIDLGYVLGRTPIAPLAMGALLVPFGGALAEPLMSLLYAASILAWFLAARRFGGGAALVTVVVLLAYPGYGSCSTSSDRTRCSPRRSRVGHYSLCGCWSGRRRRASRFSDRALRC